MINSWTKGLDAPQADAVTEEFLKSKRLRDRLTKVLEDKISTSQASSRSKDLYDNPNWTYLQADNRGYERALTEILKLIA